MNSAVVETQIWTLVHRRDLDVMDIEIAIPSNYQRLWYLWCPLTLKFLQYKLVMTAVPKPVPHYSPPSSSLGLFDIPCTYLGVVDTSQFAYYSVTSMSILQALLPYFMLDWTELQNLSFFNLTQLRYNSDTSLIP